LRHIIEMLSMVVNLLMHKSRANLFCCETTVYWRHFCGW